MDFSEAYTDRCSTVGHAARSGDIKSLRKLIKKGRSVDVPDNRGWMPIHEAAFSDAAPCLQLLINSAPSRAYVKAKTFEGESALHLAAKRRSVRCCEILLRAGADPNDLTNDVTTPLFLAVESGCEAVVKLLIKYKANINGPHSCSGWNPLHQASFMERTDLIQLLLQNGVDTEGKDDFGITPLFIAAQYGKYESLNLLLSNGADVNCQAKDKATPLFIAAQEGHEKCAELLLSTGADPNLYCNEDGWQLPIHAAAQMGRSKVLEMLMAVTSRVCNTGEDQVSPVYSAVYGGDRRCLDILLSGGYSPEAQESPFFECKTPMCMATKQRNSVMALLLLKYGFQLSSFYLLSCLEYSNFPLFRYFLSQHCPLPSGDQLDAFKQLSSERHYKEWLPYLLLAGLDPTPLLDAAGIQSANNEVINFTLEFTNWKRLSADVELLLSTHAKHFTPHKHFASLPSLMHLCRLKIRSLLKTEHLRSNKFISLLPLPVCLQDYLQYSDVLHHYGIARKDDSLEDNLENISQAND
ncbi:ankyrin repeat and SOCS box protein 3 isoform 1-T2 [Anomaloglossus baeobatrachus]|uniref:ankyrin repeat and SOCS box protein 3 isoform X1 n=1 Tax=Anomaloglossus baeobatrachus TaxID=238106 RepID=UPI003F50CB8F